MAEELHLSDLNFARLRAVIHDHTGISIGEGRKTLLVSRLRGRLRDLGVTDFKSYIALVGSDKGELQELIDRVTTNKTYFYRTPRIWSHFRDVAVEDFLAAGHARPLHVWSAAASTGDEAHTAGMLLEELRAAQSGFDYKILGTDISARVLKAAEAGLFQSSAIKALQGIRPDLVQAHLTWHDEAGFQVSRAVRSRIRFLRHDLRKRLTGAGPFDIVFLRNVLIYFTPEDQENILGHIHALMRPEGTLYIGESESLSRLDTDFEIVEPMVFRPRSGGRRPGT